MKIAAGGGVEVYARGDEDRAMLQPNFSVFDDEGYLYVSDSGAFGANDGCLWVVEPSGVTRLLTDEVSSFPNGLALSPDRRFLYVALSTLPGVVRLEVGEGRVLTDAELVVSLPGTVPDGLAFDEAGQLFVSCYAPDVIFRVQAGGKVDTFAHDPLRGVLSSPTNLAFCGRDRRHLVVANLAGWHLTRTEVDVPGAPLAYPCDVGIR
jgi:gluconolactonase